MSWFELKLGPFSLKIQISFLCFFENHIKILFGDVLSSLPLTTLLLNVMGRSKGQDMDGRKLFYCKKIGDIEFASSSLIDLGLMRRTAAGLEQTT